MADNRGSQESSSELEATNRTEDTPARRRLPREWSGTKIARERRREKNKIRQRRKRERDRAEARRKLLLEAQDQSSSDEDVGRPDHGAPNEEEEDPFAFPDLDDAPNEERVYPNRNEVQHVEGRQLATDHLLESYQAREDTLEENLKLVARSFATIKVTSNVSDSAMDKLFAMFVRYSDIILHLLQEGVIRGSYSKSIRPILVSMLLPIRCSVLMKEENVGAGYSYRRIDGLEVVPAEYLNTKPGSGRALMRTEVYVRLKDIKERYYEAHGRSAAAQQALLNCALSVDGVQESNMGSRSFVIVTLRVGSCYYLVRIFNPLIGVAESKPTPMDILRDVAEQLNADPEMRVTLVLCDMVERHYIKGLNASGARLGCEFCEAAALTKGRGGVRWTYPNCAPGQPRTRERMIHFARTNTQAKPEVSMGVIADSALYDFPDFDFVWAVAIDIFHLGWEGISKLKLVRLFVTCKNAEARGLLEQFSFFYEKMKVFSETANTSRRITVKKLKGNELAVLTMSAFPLLAMVLLRGKKEKIWRHRATALQLYVFLVRLYHYKDDRLLEVEQLLSRSSVTLENLHKRFYEEFEKGFNNPTAQKVQKTPINVHTFAHLLESRRKTGPLYQTSTEPFESMYAVLRRCYKAGTRNTGKQAFENFYIREKFAHQCGGNRRLKVAPAGRNKKVADDTVLLTSGEIVRVTKKNDDGTYTANPFRLDSYRPLAGEPKLPWQSVGIHINKGIRASVSRTFSHREVAGKAMICGDIISEWLPEWLMSKVDV